MAGRVKTLVDEVSQGSPEQTRGIREVPSSMNQMEQVTQHTATRAQQSASASAELANESRLLHGLVDQLTGLDGSDQPA
jgi:methyl-accepting chemotaxis protein